MTDFNSKLKLNSHYFGENKFNDAQFSARDYRKAYNLYHLTKAMGLLEWDLVDQEVLNHLLLTRSTNQYPDFNYLRDHLKANHMQLTVFKNVRHYRTDSRKMYFYAWGIMTYVRPDGSITKGLMILWEARPGDYLVLNMPNASWDDYEEITT